MQKSWQRGKGGRGKRKQLRPQPLSACGTADGGGLRDSSSLRLSISQETIKERGGGREKIEMRI